MRFVAKLLLPPLGCLLLLLGGLLLRRYRRRAGNVVIGAAIAGLWLAATPWVGAALLGTLQTTPALDPAALPAGPQAIVVLSAEMDRAAAEYGGQSVGPMTLQRIRYAAFLQRRTGLPLLVSGGLLPGHREAHAASMRRVLEDELGVEVRWVEAESRTTAENAAGSAAILADAGIDRVFLVTHAFHLPRAAACFARRGVAVVGAPTAFREAPDGWLEALLPRWSALGDCALAMHEWLGRAVYALTD